MSSCFFSVCGVQLAMAKDLVFVQLLLFHLPHGNVFHIRTLHHQLMSQPWLFHHHLVPVPDPPWISAVKVQDSCQSLKVPVPHPSWTYVLMLLYFCLFHLQHISAYSSLAHHRHLLTQLWLSHHAPTLDPPWIITAKLQGPPAYHLFTHHHGILTFTRSTTIHLPSALLKFQPWLFHYDPFPWKSRFQLMRSFVTSRILTANHLLYTPIHFWSLANDHQVWSSASDIQVLGLTPLNTCVSKISSKEGWDREWKPPPSSDVLCVFSIHRIIFCEVCKTEEAPPQTRANSSPSPKQKKLCLQLNLVARGPHFLDHVTGEALAVEASWLSKVEATLMAKVFHVSCVKGKAVVDTQYLSLTVFSNHDLNKAVLGNGIDKLVRGSSPFNLFVTKNQSTILCNTGFNVDPVFFYLVAQDNVM